VSFWIAALLGTAIGGAAGVIGTAQEDRREQEKLERQKQSAWKQYLLGKEHGDRQWGIQKGEAGWQLGQQERALNEGVGRFTDEYNTTMLSRAYGEQDARIQNAMGIGMSRAREGASGTRGNAANELMRAYAEQGLERNIELQRRQDSQALAGTLGEASRALGAIGHERDSWEAGGWRSAQKEAQDKYNLDLAKLGQSDFDWSMEHSRATGWDYVTGFFGGGMSGLNLAGSIYNFGWDWGKE